MRIRMTVYVDVDSAKWAEQNGVGRSEVRADVERYVSNSVRQLPAIEDAAPAWNPEAGASAPDANRHSSQAGGVADV